MINDVAVVSIDVKTMCASAVMARQRLAENMMIVAVSDADVPNGCFCDFNNYYYRRNDEEPTIKSNEKSIF